jgi:transglutaminase-like putative cysteine protease
MAELQDWSGAYKLSQLSRERANACNGKSILYMLALRAFGIRSRIVTLYATATAGIPVWSHASVDVRVDGKWVALDPTFNVALKAGDGTHLSWTAAVQKLRKGEPVIPDQDGKVLLRGQTLEAYRDRYGGNLQLLAEYALLGPWENGEAESLNPGWDGKIRYIDGSEFDAWNSLNSSFYKRIAGRAD